MTCPACEKIAAQLEAERSKVATLGKELDRLDTAIDELCDACDGAASREAALDWIERKKRQLRAAEEKASKLQVSNDKYAEDLRLNLAALLDAMQAKQAADETIADLRETERRYVLTMARLRPYLGDRVEVPEVVVGELVERIRAAEADSVFVALDREREEHGRTRENLSAILARIHGDGGHYQAANGTEEAVSSAHERVAAMQALMPAIDELATTHDLAVKVVDAAHRYRAAVAADKFHRDGPVTASVSEAWLQLGEALSAFDAINPDGSRGGSGEGVG